MAAEGKRKDSLQRRAEEQKQRSAGAGRQGPEGAIGTAGP